jgi:glycosyltransferase involved in cell wall biosynthesis
VLTFNQIHKSWSDRNARGFLPRNCSVVTVRPHLVHRPPRVALCGPRTAITQGRVGQVMPKSIALLSTYPPTQCGLATFTAALYDHLSNSLADVSVVRVLNDQIGHPSRPEVVAQLVTASRTSVASAIAKLNTFDAVIIQHEYGIYGGTDGVDVLDYVGALTVPLIVVMHTVLTEPTPLRRRILVELAGAAQLVVTMTETARTRLINGYGIDAEHVVVIPHGAIDHRGLTKTKPTSTGRPVILTWGLLGPGKGIEWAIDAMPALRHLNPRYLVVGKTHPKVLERDGQRYRNSLIARAQRLGVSDLVEITDKYLELSELAELVTCADVVLLPYDSPDQVTSGVLIEAVAAARPVVATAFPHATELLTSGSGLTVPRRDPQAIAKALDRILSDKLFAAGLAAHAATQAPALRWDAVASRYHEVLTELVAERRVAIA